MENKRTNKKTKKEHIIASSKKTVKGPVKGDEGYEIYESLMKSYRELFSEKKGK